MCVCVCAFVGDGRFAAEKDDGLCVALTWECDTDVGLSDRP